MRRRRSGKQNGRDGGRTGMKKWGKKAALLLTGGALLAGSLLLAGCQKEEPAQPEETKAEAMETEAEEETADLRTATETAQGDALRMVESGGRLFFKYRDGIYMIEEESGEMTELCRFADARENGAFWVYRGGLYFDRRQVKEGEESEFYSLCRLDLETGETEVLAELMNRPSVLYASSGRLYIRGAGQTVVYALDEDGRTAGELSPSETVYGALPEGCRELFNGVLPYYVDTCGYMPVQNDTCLVIARADGSEAREVAEITNTSSVLFAGDAFFVPFRDGSGGTQCYRYEADTLERSLLFESDRNLSLLQYRDGYLYFMTGRSQGTLETGASFYRILADGKENAEVQKRVAPGQNGNSGVETMPQTGDGAGSVETMPQTEDGADAAGQTAAEMQDGIPAGAELVFTADKEAGMMGESLGTASFYATDTAVYGRQSEDYGIYIGMRSLDSQDGLSLLNPALFQSPLLGLAQVEGEYELLTCPCGEYTAGEIYAETLVFDGDGEAVQEMNRQMEEKTAAVLASAREAVAMTDEEWIHSAGYTPYSMTFTVDGTDGIPYLDEQYVCVRLDGYEYTGGAHGTPTRDYFVFDRQTGKRLGLADVVENSQEELQKLVGSAFGRLAEETNFAFESPADLEHTVSDNISYDSPYYLSDTGVGFYFAPYTIAPYAEGFPEVTIPYEDLSMKIPVGDMQKEGEEKKDGDSN